MGDMTRMTRVAGTLACAGLLAAGAAAGQEAAPGDAPEAIAPTSAPAGPVVASFRATGSVLYGDAAVVSGRVAPARRTRVLIERLQGAAWRPLATTTSDARGRFRVELPLRRSWSIRARAALSGSRPGPRKNVTVRRRAAVSVSTHPYESIAGRPFTVTGAVVPARDGETAVIEGSLNGRAYAPLGRFRVRNGRVSGTVTPTAGGTWRFRLRGTGERTAGDEALSRATAPRAVFAANPHGVPASAPVYLVQKISEMQLYYYESGRLVRVFPVVFGKPSTPTPVGSYRVYSKTTGPGPAFGPLVLWYHRGYGIHGTNQEYLLDDRWRYYSHGCTRNYNANIRWLWGRVPVGTPVRNLA
jgi:hypothetical protein